MSIVNYTYLNNLYPSRNEVTMLTVAMRKESIEKSSVNCDGIDSIATRALLDLCYWTMVETERVACRRFVELLFSFQRLFFPFSKNCQVKTLLLSFPTKIIQNYGYTASSWGSEAKRKNNILLITKMNSLLIGHSYVIGLWLNSADQWRLVVEKQERIITSLR